MSGNETMNSLNERKRTTLETEKTAAQESQTQAILTLPKYINVSSNSYILTVD